MQGVPGDLSGFGAPGSAARAGLTALVGDPAGALVALDYDGTLAAVVPDPGSAVPAPGARELLARLAGRVRAVAIVTGRPAADLPPLAGLGGPDAPAVVVLGLYGRQRWDAVGGLRPGPPSAEVAAARADLAALLRARPAGLRIEDKGDALAVHARGAPDPEALLAELGGPLQALADRHRLRVQPGRLVRELLPAGADKGVALLGFAAEVSCRCVLYAGDDVGDLPAFAAVRTLRGRGVPGVSVGLTSAEAPEVAAAADLSVPDPAGLIRLLNGLADGWPDPA